MFDFFRRHTRVLQFLLVLLVFPAFAFVGIQGYSRFTGGDQQSVAKVAGQPITQLELDNAIRDRIERTRRQMPSLDPRLFDTPEMRKLAVEALVRERVLLVAADKLHLAPADDRLDRLFKSDPEFQTLRNADGSVNRDTLAGLGLSSAGFAERLRQDIGQRQVLQGLQGSAIAPAAAASAALDAMYQQREVQVVRFDAKDYAAKVAPTEAEIEAFYKDPAHAAQFRAPDEATVEYVVLDLESLKKNIAVPDDDLKAYYASNKARYTSTPERRASHILIQADKAAPKAEREKARARAEAVLAEVRKNPAAFAEIAKKESQDEGSAPKGGDLDWFGRGAIEGLDTAFDMKPGEISGVVESNFGFHIIQVTGARGGETKPFDAVRAEIENEIRGQVAQKKFTDAALAFGDLVYEQSDSLKPAADKWKLEIKTLPHVTRTGAPGASGAIANPKFLEALFATDVTRDKRNTKAIDVGSNQLAAGRVVQFVPAHALPLADVKDKVRAQLVGVQATAMASKLGQDKLAALRAAPATPLAEPARLVSRAQTGELPPALLDAVVKAPAAKLPALVGVDLREQGYAVARINKIAGRDPIVAADEAKGRSQYAQIWADAEAQAYYAALKTRYKASVNEGALSAPREAASEPR